MTVAPRDFYTDNGYSLQASEEPFWLAVYKKAFPNLMHYELCTDIGKQKQGIDRILYLSNGNVLYVDEKKRRSEYQDILLEHTSNEQRGTPGWMEHDLPIDYLAYAFMPSKRCYFFPWPMLRRAWLLYSQSWKAKYKMVRGKTRIGMTEYHTLSIAVPTEVLMRAVSQASIIDVSQTTLS